MDIQINKENEGEEYAFQDESNSENDEIKLYKPKRKKPMKKHRKRVVSDDDDNVSIQSMKYHKPLEDTSYEMFTNPSKIHKPQSNDGSNEDIEENDEESLNDFNNDFDEHESHIVHEEELKPSMGFNSITEEKNDLLYKFYRLSAKGVPLTKKFNANSDLVEMRTEYAKIKRDAEVNSSIKFSRRMLMACVTGMEFLNKRYDPFDIYLDGWSESVMENVEDYDNVFEKLHDKYKSKVSMPPEMELLLSLAGSAFMFHITNTMFKSIPNIGDMAKQNPDIMKTMMETMSAAASNVKQAQENQQSAPKSETQPTGQYEMKKPSFDISNILPSGMMFPSPVIPTMPNPINTNEQKNTNIDEKIKLINEDVDSIISDNEESIISYNDDVKQVSISESSNKSKKRKIKVNPKNILNI